MVHEETGQSDPNAPTEPTFDQEAEHLLERAAQQIRWLSERNALLQMKSDTVDQLCSLGKSPTSYAGSTNTMSMGAEPSFLYRIDSLLRIRKEARQAEERKAKAAAEAANASPDPESIPLGL